jgi:3-hydroxyisobutyrate dehydrogenase-like beta-hydroxyacid dehydrogenase
LEFAERVAVTGALFLDAPFTGSKPAALARQTVFYVGGDGDALKAARPVLEKLSMTILPIGEIGSASALKLAMNVNIAGVGLALMESLTIARKAGISDELYLAALRDNAGRSGLSDFKGPKLAAHDYSPQFSVKHLHKDLKLAIETAGDLDLPGLAAAETLHAKGMAVGMEEDDFVGLIRLIDADA